MEETTKAKSIAEQIADAKTAGENLTLDLNPSEQRAIETRNHLQTIVDRFKNGDFLIVSYAPNQVGEEHQPSEMIVCSNGSYAAWTIGEIAAGMNIHPQAITMSALTAIRARLDHKTEKA